MAPEGIEPTTFALLARRSNQLSYGASGAQCPVKHIFPRTLVTLKNSLNNY